MPKPNQKPNSKVSFLRTASQGSIQAVDKQLEKAIVTPSKSQLIQKQVESMEDNKNELLKILHETIAQKQIYPEEAIAKKQTGIARIGFWMDSNGAIFSTKILKSSGSTSWIQPHLTWCALARR